MSKTKPVLDACCGSRMFWFDKHNPDVVYMDNRELFTILCDGRTLNVTPDVLADFRHMPFADSSYRLVVFDPPHLEHIGADAYMAQKYGSLNHATWRDDLAAGFRECMRVLRPGGTLIVKWSENQITVRELIKALGKEPLFGNRTRKTGHWLVYLKSEE